MRLVSPAAILIIALVTVCAFAVDSVVLAKETKSQAKQTAAKSKKKLDPELVKSVQKALSDAGYKVKIDGRVGPQVRAALKKYQKKNKLKATGRIDKATLQNMGIAPPPGA